MPYSHMLQVQLGSHALPGELTIPPDSDGLVLVLLDGAADAQMPELAQSRTPTLRLAQGRPEALAQQAGTWLLGHFDLPARNAPKAAAEAL